MLQSEHCLNWILLHVVLGEFNAVNHGISQLELFVY
jgi:hypothetical protein